MAKKTRLSRGAASPSTVVPPPVAQFPLWAYALSFAAALYALFEVYGPALRGPFVFDDLYLPYASTHAATIPLKTWLGIRPVLGLSFWTDFQLWGRNTFPFHATNLLLHFASSVLLFFIFRKLLEGAGTPEPNRSILCAFGSGLFLFHPIQTEVAAYVASRSEALSLLFFLAAFCVFLYRRANAIDWLSTALVLAFFVLALGSKEPAVTLPAVLLLTDYFWNPGFSFAGIRQNARLYIPIAILGVAGGAFVFRYIATDPMIGFHIEGLSPATYFLTECRALFKYLQLFLFPVSLNIDHDFPLSHGLTEYGSLLALAGLIFLVAAAILFRKMFPFASYGFLLFLIVLSPTSSFIPINDVLVERRLYLPSFGLILILFEILRRVRVKPVYLASALAGVCCLAAFATWNRAHVWGDVTDLFRDAAAKSPRKARVHIGYANALYHQGRCREAAGEYDTASRLKPFDYVLYFNLAAAYDCGNDPDNAILMLRRSIALKPQAPAFALIGKIETKQGKLQESLGSFGSAILIDKDYPLSYAYRAAVHAALGEPDKAFRDYRECLRLDPQNELARQGLALLTAPGRSQ